MTKQFAELHVLASPFELDIRRGQFVAFLGPSRWGKTTSMRMLDRLDVPSGGEIRLEGLPVGQPDRRRGMVFQSYSSFPWPATIRADIGISATVGNDRDLALRDPAAFFKLRTEILHMLRDAHGNAG